MIRSNGESLLYHVAESGWGAVVKIRFVIWAALAIASAILAMVSYGSATNSRRDAGIALAVATVAFGRTATIYSRRRAKAKLINKTDVAHFFGVTKRTVNRWLLSGKLPKPTKKFGLLQRWDYEKIARLRKSKPGM